MSDKDLEFLFCFLYLEDLDHDVVRLTKETKPYLYDIFRRELEDEITTMRVRVNNLEDIQDRFKVLKKKK